MDAQTVTERVRKAITAARASGREPTAVVLGDAAYRALRDAGLPFHQGNAEREAIFGLPIRVASDESAHHVGVDHDAPQGRNGPR